MKTSTTWTSLGPAIQLFANVLLASLSSACHMYLIVILFLVLAIIPDFIVIVTAVSIIFAGFTRQYAFFFKLTQSLMTSLHACTYTRTHMHTASSTTRMSSPSTASS